MTCGPAREAIGVFQDEPPLGAAADHAAAWAYQPAAPSTADLGTDARSQAKAAIVAGPLSSGRVLLEIKVRTRWS